jgi:hypothetical protein
LDHENGTYTVTFQAFWIGKAKLEVEVLYTKEIAVFCHSKILGKNIRKVILPYPLFNSNKVQTEAFKIQDIIICAILKKIPKKMSNPCTRTDQKVLGPMYFR